MLKVLVEDASDLIDPPSTLFCSLEYQGVKLATKHAVVRDQSYAKFHEEAEFNISKSGNLRVKLCTLNDKTSILPQKVSWVIGNITMSHAIYNTIYNMSHIRVRLWFLGI